MTRHWIPNWALNIRFGLRAFDGTFRCESDRLGTSCNPILVQKLIDDEWVDFSETNEAELAKEMVPTVKSFPWSYWDRNVFNRSESS